MTGNPPDAARHGSTFFVPDVRICRLGRIDANGEAGEELTLDRMNLTSVDVTRVNTGSSQYSIVLSNWKEQVPNLRAEDLWPPYVYNDFKSFEFGTRLRIDMRYWPDPSREAVQPVDASHRWVPMIAGPITDMKFSFSSTGGATLTLTGEDDLFPLKNKNREKMRFRSKSEREIIEDVLRRANYPLTLQKPVSPWPSFFDSTSNTISDQLLDGQSYLEFLQKIAKRYDCEVFAEFDDLANEAPAVQFHLETARSRRPPEENLRHLYVLEYGKNLVDFTPTFKVLDQYTEVTVKGRHRIRSWPRRVKGPGKPRVLEDELYPREAGLVSGPEVRKHYLSRHFGEGIAENPYTMPNQTNIDDERGKEMAEAILRQKAREFLTITGTTIGLPHLRPGRYVEIRKMRPPFDGFYYVEKTVSRYASSGFTTQFTARRPGMRMPPYDEEE